MNKVEAQAILREGLAKYRSLTYAELKRRIDVVVSEEVTGPSGTRYQLEYQAVWDDMADGNVRVIASIDDGGIRALFPVTDSFIMSPDGRFVDE